MSAHIATVVHAVQRYISGTGSLSIKYDFIFSASRAVDAIGKRTLVTARSREIRAVMPSKPPFTDRSFRGGYEQLQLLLSPLLSRANCPFSSSRSGHTIYIRQPGPGWIASRKPCSFTIAATRFRPRPTPGVFRILSER